MKRDWFAMLAGPLAWFAAHVASWMLVPGAHDAGSVTALYVVDAAALTIAVIGGTVALHRVRQLRLAPQTDPRVPRARFLAASGLGLSALAIVLLLGLVLPILLLAPGAEP